MTQKVAMLKSWETRSAGDGFAAIDLLLSDDTRRSCILFTPDGVAAWQQRNRYELSLRGRHIIMVRAADPATIERILREIDGLGELIDHSLPYEETLPPVAKPISQENIDAWLNAGQARESGNPDSKP